MFGSQINNLGKIERNAKVKKHNVYFHLNINGKLTTNAIPHQRFHLCNISNRPSNPQNVWILSNYEKVASKKKSVKSRTKKRAPSPSPTTAKIKKNIDLDLSKNTILTKKTTVMDKTDRKSKSKSKTPEPTGKRYNEDFIKQMKELDYYLSLRGEIFRARAYKRAMETIMAIPEDITSVEQLKGKKALVKRYWKNSKNMWKQGK